MGFNHTIKDDIGLGIIHVWGKVDMQLLYDLSNEITPIRPQDILFVYRDAELGEMPADELREYAIWANEGHASRTGLRTCVVVEDQAVYGLTRLFGTHSEMAADDSDVIEYYTCYSIQEAADWLGHPLEILESEVEQLASLRT